MNNNEAIRALSALAQVHRLAIFRLLIKHGKTGLAAGDIGERIGIGATSASFHLKELDRAGLIESRREGRFRHYAFNTEAMRNLLSFLMEDCCEGRLELCDNLIPSKQGMCREETAND